MSAQAEMRTVQVRVTWEPAHTLRVPVGTEVPSTLDKLVELVEARSGLRGRHHDDERRASRLDVVTAMSEQRADCGAATPTW